MKYSNKELIEMAIENVMKGSFESIIQNVYKEIEERGLDNEFDAKLEKLTLVA